MESTLPQPSAAELSALAARMAEDLRAIELTRMPFGRFGPKTFPPNGTPIYDLPVEYLGWFERKANWPRGRLGELLRIVYQMKADGSDFAFDEMRRRAGGKAPLRPPGPPRAYHFKDDE
jgi:uncharacterized protein (DUF3820 family)